MAGLCLPPHGRLATIVRLPVQPPSVVVQEAYGVDTVTPRIVQYRCFVVWRDGRIVGMVSRTYALNRTTPPTPRWMIYAPKVPGEERSDFVVRRNPATTDGGYWSWQSAVRAAWRVP